MPTFSEAKIAVMAELNRRQPDNGMEAMWINCQKKALMDLTEKNMASELYIVNAQIHPTFDAHVFVSRDVINYMKKGSIH